MKEPAKPAAYLLEGRTAVNKSVFQFKQPRLSNLFLSPSIFIDAERERFSANNFQRTKIIFAGARMEPGGW